MINLHFIRLLIAISAVLTTLSAFNTANSETQTGAPIRTVPTVKVPAGPQDVGDKVGQLYQVQVAVSSTAEGARNAFAALMAKHKLNDLNPTISPAVVDGETRYRLRIGPYHKVAAEALCSRLQSAGQFCFLVATNEAVVVGSRDRPSSGGTRPPVTACHQVLLDPVIEARVQAAVARINPEAGRLTRQDAYYQLMDQLRLGLRRDGLLSDERYRPAQQATYATAVTCWPAFFNVIERVDASRGARARQSALLEQEAAKERTREAQEKEARLEAERRHWAEREAQRQADAMKDPSVGRALALNLYSIVKRSDFCAQRGWAFTRADVASLQSFMDQRLHEVPESIRQEALKTAGEISKPTGYETEAGCARYRHGYVNIAFPGAMKAAP